MPLSPAEIKSIKQKILLIKPGKSTRFYYFEKGRDGRTPILLFGKTARQEKAALKGKTSGKLFHGKIRRTRQGLTFETKSRGPIQKGLQKHFKAITPLKNAQVTLPTQGGSAAPTRSGVPGRTDQIKLIKKSWRMQDRYLSGEAKLTELEAEARRFKNQWKRMKAARAEMRAELKTLRKQLKRTYTFEAINTSWEKWSRSFTQILTIKSFAEEVAKIDVEKLIDSSKNVFSGDRARQIDGALAAIVEAKKITDAAKQAKAVGEAFSDLKTLLKGATRSPSTQEALKGLEEFREGLSVDSFKDLSTVHETGLQAFQRIHTYAAAHSNEQITARRGDIQRLIRSMEQNLVAIDIQYRKLNHAAYSMNQFVKQMKAKKAAVTKSSRNKALYTYNPRMNHPVP